MKGFRQRVVCKPPDPPSPPLLPRHTMADDLSTSSSHEPKTAIRFRRIRRANKRRLAQPPLMAPLLNRPLAPPRPRPRTSPTRASPVATLCRPPNSSSQCRSTNTSSNTRAPPAPKAPTATTKLSLPVSSSARALP